MSAAPNESPDESIYDQMLAFRYVKCDLKRALSPNFSVTMNIPKKRI